MAGLAHPTRSSRLFGRDRLALIADGLAVALAVTLPWSTSASGICAGLLLVVSATTFDRPKLNRVLATPAGGLPIVLLALAIIGTLWAVDATIAERLDALKPYLKLLFIPLLILQFSRSTRGAWVMIGFMVSCSVLMILSWI